MIVLLPAGFVWTGTGQEKKVKKEKAKEETKLFQLDEIIIDVIEKMRDVEIPNMTVVKPELFPMSIGTTIDTALERQAGVNVQRIQEVGTAMDDDSIKIRGLSGRRIKVLRDGRLLNTSGAAGGYFIDFTMIPLTDVDRVEVVKGVGDARYGNSLGGILNLIPRRLPSESPITEVDLSAASFNTLGVNIYHAYKPGAFEYALTGRLTRSNGYLSVCMPTWPPGPIPIMEYSPMLIPETVSDSLRMNSSPALSIRDRGKRKSGSAEASPPTSAITFMKTKWRRRR